MIRLLAAALLLLPAGAPALAQGKEAAVEATDQLKFAPDTITVAVGGTVTWTNAGATFHTVTGGENGAPDDKSPIKGQLASQGATYSVTFKTAGTYPYFCQPHFGNGMAGTIVVGKAGGSSASPKASASPAATESPEPAVESPAAGESAEPGEAGEVPGISGNKTLAQLDAERSKEETTLGGFRAFSWAATAALVALGIALFASTRTRRGGR